MLQRWLSCYAYIFAISTYLTMVNQCVTIFFPKRVIRCSKKKYQTIEKVKCQKSPTKLLYIHNKLVIEKWVNHCHFFVDEKNLQKFGMTGELISV